MFKLWKSPIGKSIGDFALPGQSHQMPNHIFPFRKKHDTMNEEFCHFIRQEFPVLPKSEQEATCMEKFEYKTLYTDAKGVFGGKVDQGMFQSELNELGSLGWELVSTVATAQSYGSTRWIISVFKRKAVEK